MMSATNTAADASASLILGQGNVSVGPTAIHVHQSGDLAESDTDGKPTLKDANSLPLLVLPLELLHHVDPVESEEDEDPLRLTLSFKEVVLQFPNKSELVQVRTHLDDWLLKHQVKPLLQQRSSASLTASANLTVSELDTSAAASAAAKSADDEAEPDDVSSTADVSTTSRDMDLEIRRQISGGAEDVNEEETTDAESHAHASPIVRRDMARARDVAETSSLKTPRHQQEHQHEPALNCALHNKAQQVSAQNVTLAHMDVLQDIQPLPAPPPQRLAPSSFGAFAVTGNSGQGDRLDPGRMTSSSHNSLAGGIDDDDVSQGSQESHALSQFTAFTTGTDNLAIGNNSSNNMLVEATLVDLGSDDLDEENQSQVLEATQLEVVLSKRAAACGVLLVAALFISLLVGLLVNRDSVDEAVVATVPTFAPTGVPSSSPSFRPITTLERVKERGVLRCGAYATHWAVGGSSIFNSSQTTSDDGQSVLANDVSADVRACRGIGAAVFGKASYSVQMVALGLENRTGLESLAEREVGVVLSHSTPTMKTDIFDQDTQAGFSTTAPYAFDGLAFAGLPFYTACADDDMKSFFECKDLKICVNQDAKYFDLIAGRVPVRNILTTISTMDTYMGFIGGDCNVMAMEASALGEIFLRVLFGYTGEYAVGQKKFTQVFFSSVTLDSDPEWADFVNMIVLAGFAAEARGITNTNASLFGRTTVFGPDHEDMFIDAISVSGNFADIYELYQDYTTFLDAMIGPGNDEMYELYETLLPRTSWNLLNNGTTGLINAPEIQLAEEDGPGPEPGGTMARILARGKVRCGVRTKRPGFADYVNGSSTLELEGMDVDYCRAIAASMWGGDASLVEFINVIDEAGGFAKLNRGDVDLFAGAIWTLQNDVWEPTTGKGFTFSQPYFYHPQGDTLGDEK